MRAQNDIFESVLRLLKDGRQIDDKVLADGALQLFPKLKEQKVLRIIQAAKRFYTRERRLNNAQ